MAGEPQTSSLEDVVNRWNNREDLMIKAYTAMNTHYLVVDEKLWKHEDKTECVHTYTKYNNGWITSQLLDVSSHLLPFTSV